MRPQSQDDGYIGCVVVQIPSPLRSSIFAGAPDKISVAGGLDMAPIEAPCPRLAGYLFECDTPKGSPNAELIHSFTGFTYIPESCLLYTSPSPRD